MHRTAAVLVLLAFLVPLESAAAASPPGQVKAGVPGEPRGGAPPLRVVPDRLLVGFEDGTPPEVVDAVLAHAGVEPVQRVGRIGARSVRVPPHRQAAALAALRSAAEVEYAEPEVLLEQLETIPNDSRWPAQWGPRLVGAPSAWDVTRGSSDVVIAVLDTGIDLSHPDLNGAFVPGYDFIGSDADPSDDHGHGTAAAGVAAARTNNREGQAGLCWTCSLMPVKVLDATGSGSSATVAKGIIWAADHGAHVISLSLGGPGTTRTLADAAAYAAGKGVVLVAAAGNDGTTSPFYPAAYPEVIGVAATDEYDRLYSWSNYGSWVDVAASGCNTATALGGSYGSFCGTSSATPIVSGLAALALSAKAGATGAEVEQAIRGAATAIGGSVKYGRVSASGTMTALGASVAAGAPGCTITGTAGDDVLKGTAADDVICGLGGNDRIYGNGGNDTLKGGADRDVLVGGPGNDTLIGGHGVDTAVYRGAPSRVAVDLAKGTASGHGSDRLKSVENVVGSGYSDVIGGTRGANILTGLGGHDRLYGRGGRDVLRGRAGHHLYGGSGSDILVGGRGRDTCYPGSGGARLISC